MKIYIIGGGPTGLAAANEIGESSESFVLIEKEAQLGGLAKTLEWGKNGFHDLGPHKLFTLDQQLMSRVKNLLEPEQWLTQTKKSSIFMNGHYLPYPPSPFSLAKVYGYFDFFKMVRDYGIAQLLRILPKLSHTVPQHFEEDLHQRVGKSLYQILFYPIALKLWGNPKKLDIKLSQGRVQTPSVLEVAATVLKLNRFQKQNTFEALEFSYPKGGLQQLWEAISEKTKDNGTYHLNHEIQEIEIGKDRVTAIHCENKITKKKKTLKLGKNDFVLSTIPLRATCKMFRSVLPETLIKLSQDIIQLNTLLLIFLKVDCPQVFEESWVFIPDPNIPFHRVSEQKSFDPSMTSEGSIVCCEIMDNEERPMKQKTEQELVELCKTGLQKMGKAGFKVLDSKLIKLPSSYPVFRPGFEEALSVILDHFDQNLSNFRTIGRQGAFNYIGTLDAMDIGYGAARCVLKEHANNQEKSWKQERQRTRHYPVLD